MVGLLFQLGKFFFGQRVVTEKGALADIIQIARMNEGFFRERGLFLNGGKFFLLLGEGLTGFGKRLCLLVGLGGQGVQPFLLPLDFELGDGQVFFGAAALAALHIGIPSIVHADAQKELDELPSPAQLKERYPDTSRWDARLQAALHKRRPVLKRVLITVLTLVILTLGALAVSADFRRAVYTMIQKFLPIEMQLTYQVDGEPLEQLPNGYSDHYVPDGFEMDDAQKFERAENFLHVYSSKETEESYTVRCSIIQPGQQSLFDNEHTVYETVKVGEADGVLGTSTDEHGKNVYTLSWEYQGITHTVIGNIPYDEIMKIAEGIR